MSREPTDRDEPVPPELQRAAARLGATSAGRAPSKPANSAAEKPGNVAEPIRTSTDAGPAPDSPETSAEDN